MSEAPDPRFFRALELFNKGRFFESHEVMEELWQERKGGAQADLYKGVIQYAAAWHLVPQPGRQGGAAALFRSAGRYLEKYAPAAFGLDLARLVTDLRSALEALEKGGLPPGARPQLVFRRPEG
jgi:predicted metal-dependent hydrolase